MANDLPVEVHLHPGVTNRIDSWIGTVTEMVRDANTADSAEQLTRRRAAALDAATELLTVLGRLFSTTDYDGEELHVFPEFLGTGLEWRYTKSGYHGGLIIRERDDRPTWSIHT